MRKSFIFSVFCMVTQCASLFADAPVQPVKKRGNYRFAKKSTFAEVSYSESVVKKILANTSTSLHFFQLRKISEYIEKNFQASIDKGIFYLPASETKLGVDLEFDPETKMKFIHTKDFIGKGCTRTFTKSIFYDADNPVMLAKANLHFNDGTKNEIEMLKKLRHVETVIHLVGAPVHTEKGKIIQEIIASMCTAGKLDAAKKAKLTMREKTSLAKDLMSALKEAHACQIAHQDIIDSNILLDQNKNPNLKGVRYRLVLIDFEKATEVNNSLDILARKDTYAAGCTLYGLFYNQEYTVHLYDKLNRFEKSFLKRCRPQDLIVGEHTSEITTRKADLDKKNNAKTITPHEKLEWIILSMLHPTFGDKLDAAYWHQELETLFPKIYN